MKSKFFIWSAVICVAALLTLLLISEAILNMLYGAKLRSTFAELKARGEPLSVSEIRLSIPEGGNAAGILQDIFIKMTAGDGGLPFDGRDSAQLAKKVAEIAAAGDGKSFDSLDKDQKEKIRRTLSEKDIAEIFRLAGDASRKLDADFRVNYSRGPGQLLPYLAMESDLARLICAKAYSDADAGNLEDAYEGLLAGLRISNQLRHEPVVVAHLVRIACDSTLISCLLDIAGRKGIDAAAAKAFIAELGCRSYYQSLPSVLDGERVSFGSGFYQAIIDGRRGRGGAFSKSIMMKNDYAVYLKLINDLKALSRQPFCDLDKSGRLTSFEGEVKALPSYARSIRISLPSILPIFRRTAGAETLGAYCTAYLGVLAFKGKHGRFPASLDELKPGILGNIPIDCLTGKPFAYKDMGGSFILKSEDAEFQKRLDRTSRGDGASANDLAAYLL